MASKIKGLGEAVERYIQGCGRFQQAIEGLQSGNVSRYEDGLIDSAIKIGSALELSLKVYLKHVSGNQLNRDEQDVVYGKANFADMLRLMKRYATPPLGEDLSSHLLDYRDMRNQAEHHGAVPRRGDLQAACETLGQFMLVYLPLEDRERRRIQHMAANLHQLGRREDGKSAADNEQRVYYRFPSAAVGAATLDGIRNSLSEIYAYLQGVAIPELTIEDGLIAAQAPAVPALLRERQTVVMERHTLFAGRESQLTQIRDFLASQSKGHIFVTGPSGYGKSALLANLITSSSDRFIWHFLNRLDGTHTRTAFLRSMVEQLLAYYRMPIRSEADLPTADDRLEALYSKLLRMPLVRANRPFILIIDGIDEAENDFVRELHIPRSLPEGKFIVFSGRATGQDYLRQLGVPGKQTLTVSLDRMDAAAIRSMLSQAGGAATSLVNDLPLVHQIARVSGGDPFYLRFMVEDIAAGVISSDMLAKQPAGLEHYLDGWWRQIAEPVRRERDLRDLLGILMVAPGPVPEQDLLLMAPELEWSLDVILPPVRRFLTVGQLGEQPIYSLCHPRFQQYLADHKLKNQVMVFRERLIDHCAQWREHRSAFDLNHYASLLAQLGRWDDLHELVAKSAGDKQEWAEARRQADGSYAGYLSDLRLAWKQADRDGETNSRAVGRQVRYALIESSIRSVAINIAPDLLEAAIECQIPGWTPSSALHYALLNPDESHRIAVLARMASKVTPRDLLEASMMLPSLTNDSLRRRAARIIANHLPSLYLPDLLRTLDSTDDAKTRDEIEQYLVHHASRQSTEDAWDYLAFNYAEEHGDVRESPEARRYLEDPITEDALLDLIEHSSEREGSDNEYKRSQALIDAIPYVPDGLVPRALDLALVCAKEGTFIDPLEPNYREDWPTTPLSLLAPRLTPDLLERALTEVNLIEQEYFRTRALMALYPQLPPPKKSEAVSSALAAASVIRDESERSLAVGAFAEHISPALLPRAVSFLTGEYREPLHQYHALQRMTPLIPDELRDYYLEAVEEIKWDWVRTEILASLLPRVPEESRQRYVQQMAANFFAGSFSSDSILGLITPFLHEEDFRSLLEEANSRDGKYRRATDLIALIPHLPIGLREQAVRDAVATVEAMDHESLRLTLQIVRYLDEETRSSLLSEILQSIQQVGSSKERGNLLESFVKSSPEEPSGILVQELISAAESLSDKDVLVRVLKALAQRMPEPSRDRLLRQALTSIWQIDTGINRWWALYVLLRDESADLVREAFRQAQDRDCQQADCLELAIIGMFLPVEELADVAEDVLKAAEYLIGREDELDSIAIASLAPKLPSHLKLRGNELALNSAKQTWVSGFARRVVEEMIVPDWSDWVDEDRASAYALWKTFIHSLSYEYRPRFFTVLAHLRTVIAPLGGPESATETIDAVFDVGAWWR